MNFDLKAAFKNEEPRKKIIVGSIFSAVIIGLFFLVFYVLFPSTDEKKVLTEIPMTQAEQVKQYNTKLVALSNQAVKRDTSYEKSLDNFFSDEKTATPKKVYANEDRVADSLNKVFEKQNRSYSTTNYSNKYNSSTAASKPAVQRQAIEQPSQKAVPKAYDNATNSYVAQEQINQNITANAQEPRKRRTFNDGTGLAPTNGTTINVITFGDQLVKNGGSIKLRVTNETTIQNIRVPRNTIVYGLISQSSDRMEITVSSVMAGNTPIQVQMIALDAKDGGKGMRLAKQNVNSDGDNVKNQASDEALGRTGVYSVPILGTLTRGAKDLLTRRRDNNEILVTDNYKLILK